MGLSHFFFPCFSFSTSIPCHQQLNQPAFTQRQHTFRARRNDERVLLSTSVDPLVPRPSKHAAIADRHTQQLSFSFLSFGITERSAHSNSATTQNFIFSFAAMSSRRLFSSQGSSPLDAVRVVSGGGSVRIEYDRSVRANALGFAGDVAQCKLQLPREAGRGPLSSWPLCTFVLFLSGSDLQLELDTVAMVSLVALSGAGAPVGQPILKKIAQRVSIATFHDPTGGAGAGRTGGDPKVCRVPLVAPRGQWCVVAVDLAAILATHCAAAASQEAAAGSAVPARSSRPGPPNLFAKAPRYTATVAGLTLDRIVLSGTAKVKEIISSTDFGAADAATRDLRLPTVLLPENDGLLQPSVHGLRQGQGQAQGLSLAPPATGLSSTPLRSVPVASPTAGAVSPNGGGAAPTSGSGSGGARPAFQVRFTRGADGKVAVAAKDLALEERLREEAEAKELAAEMERNRQQLAAVLAREEADNSYRRIIEPEMGAAPDRFGVVRPPPTNRQPNPSGAPRGGAFDGDGLGAWGDGAEHLSASPVKKPPPAKQAKASQRQPEAPPQRQRISYLSARKPFFCSKVGEACEVPPLPPAPSSLLLASVMRRSWVADHPADGVRMVRTPPAGGRPAQHVDAVNSVCTGRLLGYGVGCMDVIRYGSDTDSDESGSDASTATEDDASADDSSCSDDNSGE